MKNKCHTYFSITGNFNPEEIIRILQLTPDRYHSASDLRRDGKPFGFASCIFGTCGEYDVMVENQIRRTIAPFLKRIRLLKAIKKLYAVDFTIEVVPEICAEESTPVLAPPLDVMRFCCETETEIDIDLYVI